MGTQSDGISSLPCTSLLSVRHQLLRQQAPVWVLLCRASWGRMDGAVVLYTGFDLSLPRRCLDHLTYKRRCAAPSPLQSIPEARGALGTRCWILFSLSISTFLPSFALMSVICMMSWGVVRLAVIPVPGAPGIKRI